MTDPSLPPLAGPLKPRRRWPWLVVLLIALILILNHFFQWYPWPWVTPRPPAEKKAEAVLPSRVIDYDKIEEKSDEDLEEIIRERKKEFGLEKSVDMVVKPEESIRVGKEEVPVSTILDEVEKKDQERGDLSSLVHRITEEDLSESDRRALEAALRPPSVTGKVVDYYGVHVVRPGENLWDIHFAFLREYFRHRGIDIPLTADEPKEGWSSGVGRILKYAETMVHIFNMKTRRLDKDSNLNLLEPHEKIVVFNLTKLDHTLGHLTQDQLDRVRFNGRELHSPQAKPAGD